MVSSLPVARNQYLPDTGEVAPGRMFPKKEEGSNNVTRVFCVLLIIFRAVLEVAATQETPCVTTATGDLEIVPFQSKVFGNTRMLRVLLPPDYRLSGTHKYQVLYLNDGQRPLLRTATNCPHTRSSSGEKLRPKARTKPNKGRNARDTLAISTLCADSPPDRLAWPYSCPAMYSKRLFFSVHTRNSR